VVATEAAAVASAVRRKAEGTEMVPPAVLDRLLAEHGAPSAPLVGEVGSSRLVLSDEQVELVRAMTLSGDGVQVINAKAGSGKTIALGVARQAWEAAGYRVIGAAVAARAARELHQRAGIPANTIAKLLQDLDTHPETAMAQETVLLIDEAGMVGTGSSQCCSPTRIMPA
jgi:ATP-dependent exoDNAse (exonuclease V) alpha subunit